MIKRAIRIIARHFIPAPTIEQALDARQAGELYSYAMLGEAALTQQDADRYFATYRSAIDAIGRGLIISISTAI
jgi:RHH-type proline utilization regulon transcriptional repressor/proline dehydrogenase/delta 1-pyrroline-5-carboxylate dehydrogenase